MKRDIGAPLVLGPTNRCSHLYFAIYVGFAHLPLHFFGLLNFSAHSLINAFRSESAKSGFATQQADVKFQTVGSCSLFKAKAITDD